MSTGPPATSTSSSTTPQRQGQTTTRSRQLLLSQTPPSTIVAATSSSSTSKVSSSTNSHFPIVDEKIFSRYSTALSAEANKRKTEIADHMKRLAELRKEVEHLEQTDWMYEPIDKLLGK